MKIWDIHSRQTDGAIRGTPDGEADVLGLIFSEKAYFLALQDFRPSQLVYLVEVHGAEGAARKLIAHFERAPVHALVASRGLAPGPMLKRTDEVASLAPPGRVASH